MERAPETCKLSEFKMSDFGMNKTEIVASFYRIIERHALATIACAVPIDVLEKVAREFSDRPVDRNPFIFAFTAVVNLCAQSQHELNIHSPIDFIFDEKEGEQALIIAAWNYYVSMLPERERSVTGGTPIFRRSNIELPIQAADLCAWWYRKMYEETRLMSGWPFPWSERKRLASMNFSFNENDLRQTFESITNRLIPLARMSVSFSWDGSPI